MTTIVSILSEAAACVMATQPKAARVSTPPRILMVPASASMFDVSGGAPKTMKILCNFLIHFALSPIITWVNREPRTKCCQRHCNWPIGILRSLHSPATAGPLTKPTVFVQGFSLLGRGVSIRLQKSMLMLSAVLCLCQARSLAYSLTPPVVPSGGAPCADEWDCSLGGECTAGHCVCDHWYVDSYLTTTIQH